MGVRAVSLHDADLLAPDERLFTTSMSDVRRAEFASGRALLRDLTGAAGPIMRRPNRAPDLPAGVVGSLSHDRRYAVAVITRRSDVSAIGIDVEPTGGAALSDAEATLIVRADDVVPSALAAFVMKEATYKAWSVLGGPMLEHHDVRVAHDDGRFEATVLDPSAPSPQTTFTGTLVRTSDYWIALVISATDTASQARRPGV